MSTTDLTDDVEPRPFGARLAAAMDEHGPLCVGIDPHPGLLQEWGLDDDPAGLAYFARTCVEAFGGRVAAVKPQAAFFERHASAGIAILEATVVALRAYGTLTILDAKRGDIGSTMAAYADAYCGTGPLAADAVTVSPYLGFGSLAPVLTQAEEHGRGVFVLGLTSNPEGASVQHATGPDGRSVAAGIVEGARRANAEAAERGELGSVGLVVGATIGSAVQDLGIDLAAANAPLLAPGIGAQGATAEDLERVFGAAKGNVLASSSRQVLGAGPTVEALRRAALTSVAACATALR